MKWEIIKSEQPLKNGFFSIRKETCKKKDGSIVDSYYTIERPDVVIIGALTDSNEIVLIDQYRQPVRSQDIELPAGYIEDHENNIEDAARRELLEETGFEVKELKKIQESFTSAGFMDNKIHFYIGFGAHKISEPNLDEHEEIEVRVTPWEEAIKLMEQEKIKDMASVTGILLIKKYLDEQKA